MYLVLWGVSFDLGGDANQDPGTNAGTHAAIAVGTSAAMHGPTITSFSVGGLPEQDIFIDHMAARTASMTPSIYATDELPGVDGWENLCKSICAYVQKMHGEA